MNKLTQDIVKKSEKKKKNLFAKGFLTSFIIFLILIVSSLLSVFFNLGGLKSIAAQVLQIEKAQKELILEKQQELDSGNKYLQDALTKLASDQQNLKKETDKIEIQKLENEKTKAKLSSEKLSTEQLIAIYNLMEPQKVADIIAVEDDANAIRVIIKNMDQKKIAQIISLMTTDKAAKILAEISK